MLPHVVVNTARGSANRAKLIERSGGKQFQVPYLADPNTGIEMFESIEIQSTSTTSTARRGSELCEMGVVGFWVLAVWFSNSARKLSSKIFVSIFPVKIELLWLGFGGNNVAPIRVAVPS